MYQFITTIFWGKYQLTVNLIRTLVFAKQC